MSFTLLSKIVFILEILYSGIFILGRFLLTSDKIPSVVSKNFLEQLLVQWGLGLPFVLGIILSIRLYGQKSFNEAFRKHLFSIFIYIPMLMTWGDLEFTYYLAITHLFASTFSLYTDEEEKASSQLYWDRPKTGIWERLKIRPAQIVLLSFSGVILLGTLALVLPISSAKGESIPFLDALFTATSATCVTGLSTISLMGDLSLFGQIVVLVLIQIGGLSIMTLYSSMVILLGKSISMGDRVILQDLLDVSGMDELFTMIADIVKYTFIIEVWGGIILTVGFMQDSLEGGTAMELSSAIYYGFFHSISAFCNAGFSLFDNSLVNYANRPLVHGTIIVLITLGGLGFIVLRELKDVFTRKKTFVRIGLHSKVVIITSVSLTLIGTIFIFFSEFLNALEGYSLWEKFQISLFQSVTLRTAGFNTITLTNLNSYTLYAMTLFMFIGGSPGSTAGGLKTTTLAILIESIKATLTGKKDVLILDRKIPSAIVVRTTALTMISILVASFFILFMMRLEPNQSFLTIFFEVMSASGTVGLTLGVTPFLSSIGKVAISLLMLIGRIGPLTLVLAVGQKNISSGKFDYPNGRIMIG